MAATARDPVCGTIVDIGMRQGRMVEYKSASYFFCSDTCQSRFREHPDDYVPPPTA